MVAKGHDFPDVVLGVVLDADSTLRFPDFRAEERTFALVAQLAGAAAAARRGGRVLVQTLAPDAAAIRHAAAHDAAGFLAGELERRRALGYPPFAHLVRIELAAPSERRARAGGRAARATRSPPALPAGARAARARRRCFGVRGPPPAPAPDQGAPSAAPRSPRSASVVEAAGARTRGCARSRSRVDVDPQ